MLPFAERPSCSAEMRRTALLPAPCELSTIVRLRCASSLVDAFCRAGREHVKPVLGWERVVLRRPFSSGAVPGHYLTILRSGRVSPGPSFRGRPTDNDAPAFSEGERLKIGSYSGRRPALTKRYAGSVHVGRWSFMSCRLRGGSGIMSICSCGRGGVDEQAFQATLIVCLQVAVE
jgi:hypothetical protein